MLCCFESLADVYTLVLGEVGGVVSSELENVCRDHLDLTLVFGGLVSYFADRDSKVGRFATNVLSDINQDRSEAL